MNDDLFADAEIDLTPLIDVVFMLLVFFIMTTTFSRPVLDIILPKSANAEKLNEKPKEMLIGIKADGSIWHNEQNIGNDQLPSLFDARPDALLNLHVDEKAPFDAFVRVIDLAKEKRGGRFVITTRLPNAR